MNMESKDELKGCLFVHFKGNVYRVLNSRVRNENGTFNVLYERVYPFDETVQLYTQPLERFEEVVYRDGQKYLRFYCLNDTEYKELLETGEYPCLIYKPKNQDEQ